MSLFRPSKWWFAFWFLSNTHKRGTLKERQAHLASWVYSKACILLHNVGRPNSDWVSGSRFSFVQTTFVWLPLGTRPNQVWKTRGESLVSMTQFGFKLFRTPHIPAFIFQLIFQLLFSSSYSSCSCLVCFACQILPSELGGEQAVRRTSSIASALAIGLGIAICVSAA